MFLQFMTYDGGTIWWDHRLWPTYHWQYLLHGFFLAKSRPQPTSVPFNGSGTFVTPWNVRNLTITGFGEKKSTGILAVQETQEITAQMVQLGLVVQLVMLVLLEILAILDQSEMLERRGNNGAAGGGGAGGNAGGVGNTGTTGNAAVVVVEALVVVVLVVDTVGAAVL